MQKSTTFINKHSKVRILIEALGIKQRDFCDATGYSSGTVSQLYNGIEPLSVKAAWKIKEAYPRVNIHWLLDESAEIWDIPSENMGSDVQKKENLGEQIALIDAQNRSRQLDLVKSLTDALTTASEADKPILREVLSNLIKNT